MLAALASADAKVPKLANDRDFMYRTIKALVGWRQALRAAAAAGALWIALSGAETAASAQSPSVIQAGSSLVPPPSAASVGSQTAPTDLQHPATASQATTADGSPTGLPSALPTAAALAAIAPPAASSPDSHPPPKDNAPAIVGYVGLTAAGVGAVVGIISGAMAWSKTSQLKTDCSGTVCPADRLDDVNSTKNLAGLSTISFAFALFGVAIGVGGFVLAADRRASEPSSASTPHMQAVVGLGSAALQGSF